MTAFNNTGTVNLNGAGTLTLGAGGTDSGLYDIDAGRTLVLNAGTRTLGAGSDVAGLGTLSMAGGTLNIRDNLGIAGSGTIVQSAGTLDIDTAGATLNIANSFAFSGGTLTGADNITLPGAFNWSGGTISGSGSFTTSGISTLSGASDKFLNGRAWTNQGTANLTTGRVRIDNTSVTNDVGAVFNIGVADSFTIYSGSGVGTFSNAGTLNWNAPTDGQIGTSMTAFNNTGTVNLNGPGKLQVVSPFTQSGTIQLTGGSTIARSGGFTSSGLLTGSGTIDVTGGALTNNGSIRPDGGGADVTGTLSITGNYVQTAAGTLDLQAEGTGAGAFDRLAVSGSATLNGTLAVATASGFVPTAGQSFGFVTYGSSSGAFSTITAPAFPGLNPTYGATSAVFQVQSGCGVDVCWIGSSGDWGLGSNWSTGSTPTAGQSVRINVAGAQTVTMSSGAFNPLNIDSAENLTLSGGSLTVAGLFGMNAGTVLAISGGALLANGTLTAPTLNLSSGSLSGSGNITVNTDFNQTGGTFNPTGNLDLTRSLGNFNLSGLATNGTIRLVTTGLNDIILNGSLQATNTGLAAGQYGINVSSGRDILIASTANLSTTTSGAIRLQAARDVNLKVDDSGFSANNTSINAVGNLDIVATSGQILRTDGNLTALSAAAVALTAGANINAFGNITATSGNVTLGAGTTLSTSGFSVIAPGNITLNAPGTVSVSGLTTTGATSDISITSDTANISGGSLSAGNDIGLNSATGLVMGAMTAGTGGNGVITIANTGAASDISLNGAVQATNAALADNVAAVTMTSGRDILIASTTNLSSITSGAIKLNAAASVNLKVDDAGFNGSNSSLSAAGNLNISAGTSITRTDGNAVSGAAKVISLSAGTTITPGAGGSFVASTGDLSFTAANSINTTGLTMTAAQNLVLTGAGIIGSNLSATAGLIDINSSAGVSLGALSAGTSISVDGTAALSLGALTTGNGVIAVGSTGAASDISLNGAVQASNTGLAAGQYGINVSSARDILIASTANLSTTTSGAIRLQAARDVNLKVDDSGFSANNTSINAVGNLDIVATSGQILRTDGNLTALSAAAVALTAGANINAFGNITATSGNVTLGAGTTLSTSGFNVVAPGNITLTAPGAVSVSVVTTSGAASDISITSSTANISGGTLSAGNDIGLNSVTGLVMGTMTAGTGGNGVITLTNTGGGSDISLNGNLQATNAALADNVAAITVTSGRNILIASATNLTSITSGAIKLAAAASVNLKVDDSGFNASSNFLSAAGNLNITAGTSITRTDGNAVSGAAKAIDLSFGTTLNSAIGLVPTNSLSITKTAGDLNTASFSVPTLNFNAPGGNVVFAPGSVFGGGPVTVGGSGSAVFDSGAVTFNSGLSSTIPLAIGGATVAFNATVAAPALSMSAGSATFSLSPALPNVALSGGTMTINGGAAQSISGGTWNVGGSATLNLPAAGANIASGAALDVSGGAVNYGSNLLVDGTLGLASGTLNGTGPINVSSTGAVTKTGPATFTIANPLNNNGNVTTQAGSLVLTGDGSHGGTFTAAAGSTIDFQGGTHNFADGTVLAGPGNFDGGGTLIVTGSGVGLVFAPGTNIDLNALGLVGGGSITANGVTRSTGFTWNGSFVNGATGDLKMTNGGVAGDFVNYGTFEVSGAVTLSGAVADQLGGAIVIPDGASLRRTTGEFRWVAGTIGKSGGGAVSAGTLDFSAGGSFKFAGSGDRIINGLNFSFTDLTLPDGSLTLQSGSLTLTGATVLPAGVALNLFGGTLTNNGTLDVGGTFGLTGGAFGGTGSLSMSGGRLSLPAGNAVAWTNSGVLTNTGTLNLADSTITNAIDNQGIIFLEGGLTFTQAMTNTGTLNAQPGNAVFAGGLVQQPGGSIVLNDGSLQGNIDLNAGSLSGRGTVNGNLVIGNAMLAPGFSPGAITINGNLSLAGGSVLGVELGGVVQGTGYDWINVLGTANLAGTLNVSNVGGFVPAAGAIFTIMNFASSTGAFAVVNLPLNINPAPAPTSFTLVVPVVAVNTVPPLPPLPPVPAAVVALRQADPSEPLSDGVKILAPLAQPEDKREIEVEGCR